MKRVFSGVQPTNNLHLGNYLGAIKNWVEMQTDHDCIYCVVDLHAITVKQDPKILKQNIINTAKTYVALGVDPEKSIIFVQSDVKEHTELAWILNTLVKMSELKKMTQFKDKSAQHRDNINLGLFAYPALLAADILLYDTDEVPVGEDQTQHVELTRTLANRFNNLYGETFKIPEAIVKKEGRRIMGLDDPSKKMSKSAPNANNYVSLLDQPNVARKKIMRAVTDSGSEVKKGKDKPAISNLLDIYSLMSGLTIKELEKQYENKGYGDFKKGLADMVVGFLEDFQNKFNKINDKEIIEILRIGASKASLLAEKKMNKVGKKIGIFYH